MNGDYDEIQTHLLILILKTQLELLNRLRNPAPATTIRIARPPRAIYTPPKEAE